MSNKIRLGILGGGGDSLIGVLHRVAANMFDQYEIVGGVFNPNFDENKSLEVSLVQPNIHLFDKRKKSSSIEIIESIIEFSKPEIIDSVDLLIWP